MCYADTQVQLSPGELLFHCGDPSDSGIFIVVRGTLGVFLPQAQQRGAAGPPPPPIHANTLRWVSGPASWWGWGLGIAWAGHGPASCVPKAGCGALVLVSGMGLPVVVVEGCEFV